MEVNKVIPKYSNDANEQECFANMCHSGFAIAEFLARNHNYVGVLSTDQIIWIVPVDGQLEGFISLSPVNFDTADIGDNFSNICYVEGLGEFELNATKDIFDSWLNDPVLKRIDNMLFFYKAVSLYR